ncbi:MAG TPA: hypothetical protein VGG27_00305 [Magnetospirillaceae bacterium]|jgi:hypothetical protein
MSAQVETAAKPSASGADTVRGTVSVWLTPPVLVPAALILSIAIYAAIKFSG